MDYFLRGNGLKETANIIYKKISAKRSNMKMVATVCPLCNSKENYRIVYRKNFKEEDINITTFSARRLPDRVHYQIVVCNNDGLIRSNPVLDDASLFDLYIHSGFTYEKEINNLTTTYIEILNNILPSLSKGSNILEVGCGNGFILAELVKMGYGNVYGVEPSKSAVEKAEEKIRERIEIGMLHPGMFNTSFFDFIFFFQTLDHIKDPSAFIQLCYNLLRPEGIIMAFNHDIKSLPVRLLRDRSPVIDVEHTFFYSKDTIKKLFEKNKLETSYIYSPSNVVSIGYLIHLIPIPNYLKIYLSRSSFIKSVFMKRIRLKLGNLCIIVRKSGKK